MTVTSSTAHRQLIVTGWGRDTGQSLELATWQRLDKLRACLNRRRWPLATSILMLVTGLIFMFTWLPVAHHVYRWDTGGDLWGIFRAAHFVGWGFVGGVYTPSNGVNSFPGMPVLLAPIAMLSGILHLTESNPLMITAYPTAALIVQPAQLLLASTVVFATDALAERLRVSARRRISVCILIGCIAWPIAAVWGHAEDALAMTFALYALEAVLDQKWSRCGWLLGMGIVMQPLVAMMFPLLLAATPGGKRVMLAARSAALSLVLVGVAFAGNAKDAYQALVKQPTPPSLNHATPWVALAPRVIPTISGAIHNSTSAHVHPALAQVISGPPPAALVAGGPGRTIDVILALLVGLYVWHRPQGMSRVLWLAAAVLASRCFFEAVMTPYYLAPPLLLALVLAARQNARRFWTSAIIAIEITIFSYHHLNPWVWWLPIVTGLAAILAFAYPNEPIPSEPTLDGEPPTVPVDLDDRTKRALVHTI